MLVAWVYVVPPLGARLDQQKLVDMRGNVNIISSTVNEFVRYDPSPKTRSSPIAPLSTRSSGG